MSITKTHWRAAASRAAWFNLSRHDDDPVNPVDPPEDPDNPEEPEEPEGDDPPEEDPDNPEDPEEEGLGEAGKKALARMKAERAAAKKEAATAKRAAAEERRKSAALAKKVADFEDRDKSELEKATAAAERAGKQAAQAVARAVAAEVKAGAAGRFADPTDATDALMRDPAKYVDADGDIDTDAIEADLADLLERKPHWAVPAPAPQGASPSGDGKKPVKPKPDPGQGSRGAPPPVDFRTASKDELAAELAKHGYRQRSL